MDLELYGFEVELNGFGDLDRQLFRWDAFVSGFAPLKVTHPHDDFANYWRLQLPSYSIRFYAPLVGQLKELDILCGVLLRGRA